MPQIGQNLSHYSIVEKIGKGGMGEVFRAKDQKLGRDVAIKVLPEEFALDSDRVARFQREAKLLASLNHPNIAAIHGLEESDGTNFLVLELVEGETLADRLKRGPIPVEESLKLALQISEALEAAHEKGVIHRDLKPANIKVTPDGKVKVLDFGLAKAYAGDREEVNLSNSPTLSDAATQQGVILGTAAYMPPEQARGKPVDKRADIWAFGCVLYEMLTGRQTWSGATVTDIIAAALAKDPDFTKLPDNLNPDIRKLLTRCLQKDPAERFRDIGDVRVELKQILADPGGVLVQPFAAAEPRRKLRTMLPWAAITLILIIIAGVAVWYLRTPEPRQVMRFDYDLPEGQQLTTTGIPLAVSPDGKQFVYSTTKGLYLRSVNELTAKLIAGTEGRTQQPFFSPDGKWIGYFSADDRQLKKISINGGAPVTLCAVTQLVGAWWSADNTVVYGQYPPGPIMRISANGGAPDALIKTKSEILTFPQVLPDGKSILYTRSTAVVNSRVMVDSLKSGESKELFAGAAARYLPTGHIVYELSDNTNLFAVPFDLNTLEVKGGPVPIVEGAAGFTVSDAGTLAYLQATESAAAAQPGRTLVWVNREGKEEPLGAPPNDYMYPKISPDGTRVAVSIGPGMSRDIWIWDIARKTLSRLTFEKTREMTPVWSPDGKRIAYWSDTLGASPNGVYLKAADGTGEAEKLISAPDPRQLHLFSWSGDGKALLMQEMITWTNMDLCMLSMEGDHAKKPLLQTQYSEAQPQISPDGRWIAYSSNETTGAELKTEVYVRPFPDVNKGKWQVSTGGGNSPLWSPDGRELFYLSEDASAMAVSVETKPTLRFGTPKMLFKNTNLGLTITSGTPWDIHPDGKRFLMMKPPASTAGVPAPAGPRKINIVLNWLEELKQRVPTK